MFKHTMMIISFVIASFFQPTAWSETKESPNSNDTKPIIVNAKEPHFTIRLRSNPTTGYRWYIRSYPADFISSVSHSIAKPSSTLIGAPTQEIFEFKINRAAFKAPHHFIIRFTYLRPFEANGKTEGRAFKVITGE